MVIYFKNLLLNEIIVFKSLQISINTCLALAQSELPHKSSELSSNFNLIIDLSSLRTNDKYFMLFGFITSGLDSKSNTVIDLFSSRQPRSSCSHNR